MLELWLFLMRNLPCFSMRVKTAIRPGTEVSNWRPGERMFCLSTDGAPQNSLCSEWWLLWPWMMTHITVGCYVFTQSPRAYKILWLLWGGLRGLPLRYQRRSNLWPHVAINHLFVCIFRDHMQKFGPKSQNLSEISGFENIVRLRFPITLTSEKLL